MAVGRPTLYDESYCEGVIDFMGQGYSYTAYAGHIRVNLDTLYEWQKVHPEFSEATKIAKNVRCATLERELLAEDVSPRVTARIFALKNAAPHEWADKKDDNEALKDAITVIKRIIVDSGTEPTNAA